MSAIGLLVYPEPRQFHGYAMVRSNCELKYAH